MGMNNFELEFEKTILKSMGLKHKDLKIAEMGNIEFKISPRFPAKILYTTKLEVQEHVSFDLNGRWGSLKHNLCNQLPKEFHNRFDIVTNYGTGEHVANQYMFFLNMHILSKVGGIMFHSFVVEGSWPDHCNYFYNNTIAKNIASLFNYKILSLETKVKYPERPNTTEICQAAFQKTSHSLPTAKLFDQVGIIKKDGC